MAISDASELGKALDSGQSEIEIEGDLKNKVVRIRAIGPVAWAVALAAIGVTIALIVTWNPAAGLSATAGMAILGTAAATAVGIAKSGGLSALKQLRDYRVVEEHSDRIVLRRR